MGICTNKSDIKSKPKPTETPSPAPTGKEDIKPPPRVIIFPYALLKNMAYQVIREKLDEQNERVKVIRQANSRKQYVLKYILGSSEHLKKIQSKIDEYSSLRFAYLVPIGQKQYESDQILLRLHLYENTLDKLVAQNYSRCDKLIVLYRIARAIQYLEKNSIRHNKISLGNIFSSRRQIFLGLPSWSPTNERQIATRILHVTAFTQIFTAFFPENAVTDEALKSLIKQMKECSSNQMNIDIIIKSIFELNFLDEPKVIEESKKTIIQYEEGAKYEGQIDENKNKEGYGTMTELQSVYWGNWVNNRRSNRGCWKGKDLCYVGQWKDDQRQGLGLQINQVARLYYQGDFLNGVKAGYGIWEGSNGEVYLGDWKGNKKQGYGTYYDGDNKFYYEGRWKQDMKCGRGRQIHSNGIYYDGTFKDNLKDGQGHYIHPNRFQYTGEFIQNSITGFGFFKDKDGNQYNGELKNGEYEGRGKYQNKDKNYFYDGQWLNGERHGEGEEKTKDSVYVGKFVRNIREGKGTLNQLNQKYIGQFRRGKATGKGEYFYENMDIYKGDFVDKIKQGKGLYISSADGSTYEGQWHNDKKHGKGKHTLKTGQYYDGEWVESKREGFGKQYTNDLNRYEGQWKNDKKQGKGVQYEGGNRYQGQFVNGLKHCESATLIFANGDRYEGSFVQNRQQGQGKYTWKSGDEYVGGFIANNRQGEGKMIYLQSQVTYEGGWKSDKRQGSGKQKYKNGEFVGEFINDEKHGLGVRVYLEPDGAYKLAGPWVNDKRSGEFDFYFPDQTSEKRQYFEDREIRLGMTALPL